MKVRTSTALTSTKLRQFGIAGQPRTNGPSATTRADTAYCRANVGRVWDSIRDTENYLRYSNEIPHCRRRLADWLDRRRRRHHHAMTPAQQGFVDGLAYAYDSIELFPEFEELAKARINEVIARPRLRELFASFGDDAVYEVCYNMGRKWGDNARDDADIRRLNPDA